MGRKLGPLPVTPYSSQYRRRVISEYWRPAGYDRRVYRDMAIEQNAMSTLGGPNDQLGVNPDRYQRPREDGLQ